jgi:hypothetical protein
MSLNGPLRHVKDVKRNAGKEMRNVVLGAGKPVSAGTPLVGDCGKRNVNVVVRSGKRSVRLNAGDVMLCGGWPVSWPVRNVTLNVVCCVRNVVCFCGSVMLCGCIWPLTGSGSGIGCRGLLIIRCLALLAVRWLGIRVSVSGGLRLLRRIRRRVLCLGCNGLSMGKMI